MRASIAALAVLAVQAAGASAPAGAGVPPHWARGLNPVVLTYSLDAQTGWSAPVRQALAAWTAAAPNVISFREVASGGQIEIVGRDFGDTGWSGLARLSVAQPAGHVVRATVWLNDAYAGWADPAHTACHEIGHALGLPHRAGQLETSCMREGTPAGGGRPGAADVVDLQTRYLHSDG